MRPPSPDAESHGQIIPPVRPRAAACSTLAASTHRLPELRANSQAPDHHSHTDRGRAHGSNEALTKIGSHIEH